MAALNWPVGQKVSWNISLLATRRKREILFTTGAFYRKWNIFSLRPSQKWRIIWKVPLSLCWLWLSNCYLMTPPPPSHRLLNLNGPPNAEGGDYTVFLTLRPPPPAGSSSARPDLDWSDVIINRKTASSWSRYHHLRLSINLIKTLIWFISMTLLSKLLLFVDTATLGGFHLINPLSHRSMDAKIRFFNLIRIRFLF